jgi:hypothetical protein
VDHGDHFGLDPEGAGDQPGEGGLVALAVGGDPGPDGDPAVGRHLDLAVLGPEPGDLDVQRQPDPELAHVAALAAPGLVGP